MIAAKKRLKKLPPNGTPNVEDLYMAVGHALTWWEAAEDAFLQFFSFLCEQLEPTAFGSYVRAPRNVRTSMLQLAMENHSVRLSETEISNINEYIKISNKLAIIRNEIAHGCVRHISENEDGKIIVQGNYLLPSLEENDPLERSVRFHHTLETIIPFIEQVEKIRWGVIQVEGSARQREQKIMLDVGGDSYMYLNSAIDIAWRKIPMADASIAMRSYAGRVAARKGK